jgi:hypothetical protein
MTKKSYTFLFFTSLLFLIMAQSYGQQKIANHNNVWFGYLGKNNFSEKLSLTLEASLRYADLFESQQQWFVRPSLDYHFSSKLSGSIGYTYVCNNRYGKRPIFKVDNPENNVWLQMTYVKTNGKFRYTHRLRDENRSVAFIKDVVDKTTGKVTSEISQYGYRNRLRYLFLFNYTLIEKNYEPKLMTIIGDELFLNVGSISGKTLVNQNRVILGLGYNINNENQIQVAYVHQNIWNYANTILENNPTIRLSYVTNFDWY